MLQTKLKIPVKNCVDALIYPPETEQTLLVFAKMPICGVSDRPEISTQFDVHVHDHVQGVKEKELHII